jgi:hypothetical protein
MTLVDSNAFVQSCSIASAAKTTCAAVMPMKHNNAVCEMSLIPKRSTKREFMNAAQPIVIAHSANMLGIKLARRKTSEKI